MIRKACIIGYPVRHSRSPLIHSHWLGHHGLAGSYTHAEVNPHDFAAFVQSMPDQGFVGGNITLPHKTRLLELAVHRSQDAEAIGAANTLWFEDGRPCVDNTDSAGFLKNLDQESADWDQNAETALVLGAGGASRAIVYGLVQRGVPRILLANRTLANAQEMARDFGSAVVPIVWGEAARHAADVDLLVNTTSLGMEGQGSIDLDLADLPPHAVVTDAIYVPLETELLQRARLRGLRTVGGLGMLLHQAVPGFERWFGVRPVVTAMLHDLVAADIAADH